MDQMIQAPWIDFFGTVTVPSGWDYWCSMVESAENGTGTDGSELVYRFLPEFESICAEQQPPDKPLYASRKDCAEAKLHDFYWSGKNTKNLVVQGCL